MSDFKPFLLLNVTKAYVHTKPDKFENGVFVAKTEKCLRPHYRFRIVSLSTLKRCWQKQRLRQRSFGCCDVSVFKSELAIDTVCSISLLVQNLCQMSLRKKKLCKNFANLSCTAILYTSNKARPLFHHRWQLGGSFLLPPTLSVSCVTGLFLYRNVILDLLKRTSKLSICINCQICAVEPCVNSW